MLNKNIEKLIPAVLSYLHTPNQPYKIDKEFKGYLIDTAIAIRLSGLATALLMNNKERSNVSANVTWDRKKVNEMVFSVLAHEYKVVLDSNAGEAIETIKRMSVSDRLLLVSRISDILTAAKLVVQTFEQVDVNASPETTEAENVV